jgi:hypothetical protein
VSATELNSIDLNARPRWKWLNDLAAIDLRALAVLRIGVALILLVDLVGRAWDLGAFYTDDGILPRAGRVDLAIRYCEPWWMSLHMLSGSWLWSAFLACLAGAAAIALLVGWRTKTTLVISWLLLYSIQARFPMLLQGGDVLLRCSLVWMFFLPIDGRWSLNSRKATPTNSTSASSIGGLGLLAQLGSMYFFSALLKTSPMWTSDFSATYYALNIDHFTRPLGYALAEYPRLLQGLTASAIVLEFTGPLLMFEPVGRKIWRWLIPVSFIGFHLGLFVCMELGTFPWVCIVCWMTFLPTGFWDRIERIGCEIARLKPIATGRIEGSAWYGGAASNAIAGFLLLYVLALNTAKLKHPYSQVGSFPIYYVGHLTGLEQYWNMFAPGPYAYGSWIRVEGVLPSGGLVNLYESTRPLSNAKPLNVSALYPTQYWRRCFVMGYEVREKPHLEGLLRYLARKWNDSHSTSDQIVAARFVFIATPTPPPGAILCLPSKREVLCEITIAPPAIAQNER